MSRGRKVLFALVGSLLAIQLVPYGRAHDNPPVSKEPAWDAPRTRELATRACFDCHSHETKWPWYSHVAPMSWFVAHHVDEGRDHLNFSTWDRPSKDADECSEAVSDGWMPLDSYLWIHPEARLSEAEKTDLAAGFTRMFGKPKKD
jgi:hypothetical protein